MDFGSAGFKYGILSCTGGDDHEVYLVQHGEAKSELEDPEPSYSQGRGRDQEDLRGGEKAWYSS